MTPNTTGEQLSGAEQMEQERLEHSITYAVEQLKTGKFLSLTNAPDGRLIGNCGLDPRASREWLTRQTVGLNLTTQTTADRLRALLAAKFPGTGAPPVHTALLLLNTSTGQEEVRLYAKDLAGTPGYEKTVFRSETPHSAFALDLIEALHAHRLHHWRPLRDTFMPGVINLTTRRVTGQIGWALDLRHLTETE
ncbi:hypothetical protein [Streptomyces sp. NPDC001404]|uniref:hypothetical protein n=1 Tax=Streptomyces sp. NPDC001404 TaxID=3364571 RepID=UPI0036BE5D8A